MATNRFGLFVLAGFTLHAALFAAGFTFIGLAYTLLVAFGWAISWMLYCGVVASKWDERYGLYDDAVSVLALALIGGPFCWILCPTCLLPQSQRKASGFVMLWFMVQYVLSGIRTSVLRIMAILHGYCEREFPSNSDQDPEEDI